MATTFRVILEGGANSGKTSFLNYLEQSSLVSRCEKVPSSQRELDYIYTIKTSRGSQKLLIHQGNGHHSPYGLRTQYQAVILLFDISQPESQETRLLHQKLEARYPHISIVPVGNKVDLLPDECPFEKIFHRISTHTGQGIQKLVESLLKRITSDPHMYVGDESSSTEERVSEINFE